VCHQAFVCLPRHCKTFEVMDTSKWSRPRRRPENTVGGRL
jgi:hypothetical protein